MMASGERQVDVIVVGSCNMDLISYVSRFPKPGETIHGSKFNTGFGGKGANQCVMAARLGAKTAMIGKVGDDSFGRDTINNFKENEVITDFLGTTDEASTGVAPILVEESGQNSIVIVSGANFLVTPTDVEHALKSMQPPKVLLCQLEILQDTTLAALKAAKALGVTTVFNPAPAVSALPDEFYKYSDFFCPNESETKLLTGLTVSSVNEAKAASLVLLDKGCKAAVITLGGDGIVYATAEDRNPVHIPAPPTIPVDTTGAGDAFIGSLAFYLSNYPSLELRESLRRSCHIASMSVLSQGTQTSFPWRRDIPEDLL